MSSRFKEFRKVDDILDDLDHTFRERLPIGINGFGPLGRAIFCASLNWPHVLVAAINDPFVDAKQAAEILQGDDYRDSLHGFEVVAPSSEGLIIRNSHEFITITFRSEPDPSKIGWKAPNLNILYVIECSGKFTTLEEISRHLHIGRTYDQELEFKNERGIEIWDEGGAMKVLVASTLAGVPTFEPGVDERDCRFQDHVVGCVTLKQVEGRGQGWDLEVYSSRVLRLLNIILARDGRLGNYRAVLESGFGPTYGEKCPFLEHLERLLASNLEGSTLRDLMDNDLVEMANEPNMLDVGPCGCCQGEKLWARH